MFYIQKIVNGASDRFCEFVAIELRVNINEGDTFQTLCHGVSQCNNNQIVESMMLTVLSEVNDTKTVTCKMLMKKS
jgi:hypothetical protein